MKSFDIAIIGAGPAGAACALALRKADLSVALIDKAVFPRDKVCGDAIPGGVLKALRKLDSDFEDSFLSFEPKSVVRSSKIFSDNGKSWQINWRNKAFDCSRMDFDGFLFDLVRKHAKSVELLNETSIKRVERSAKGIALFDQNNESIEAKLVIGCDGANSIVARQLAYRKVDPEAHAGAVRVYFKDIEGLSENTMEFFILKNYMPGYFWIFPLPEGLANVGFGMLTKEISRQKYSLRKGLMEIIETHPQIAPRFANAQQLSEGQGFGLPLGGKKSMVAGDRFLLAGDAGSLIDPLLGHGIDKAMHSGILAAEQAMRCFELNDFSQKATRQYEDQIEQLIGQELRKNYRTMRWLARFPKLLSATLNELPIKWLQSAVRLFFQ